MKVVFLAPYLPLPVRHGGQRRTLQLLQAITRFAEVELLAIGGAQQAEEARRELDELGVPVEVFAAAGPQPASPADDVAREPDAMGHFRSAAMAAALDAKLRDDPGCVVHFEELVMAQYLGPWPNPTVIDRQKVEWAYHESLASLGGPGSLSSFREAERFKLYERRLATRFDATLVTGPDDARRVAELSLAERVHVAPITVASELACPKGRSRAVEFVLLYGRLDYRPNADAHRRYFEGIWPVLRDELPDLRTVVVGAGDDRALPRDDPRVEVRGFVPDVGAVLTSPGVLVAPLAVGGGVRTKFLEALACGMPVVSTAAGAENLGLEAGRHFLRAQEPAEFVDAVKRLHAEPGLVEGLGQAGARYVDDSARETHLVRAMKSVYVATGKAVPPKSRRPRKRPALLIGVGPLPDDLDATALSFPGHRTAQLWRGLEDAGYEVTAVLRDEEPERTPGGLAATRSCHLLDPPSFDAGHAIERVRAGAEPLVVVAAGGYHAARAVGLCSSSVPCWIDLAGDLAAEGALRARFGDGAGSAQHRAVLHRALRAGDHFSVVGPSQRLALLGQLALLGRLRVDPNDALVSVVPLSCADGAPVSSPRADPFTVLLVGGFNAWMDEHTLFEGLSCALDASREIRVVSIGGPVPGQSAQPHQIFWRRVATSKHASRFDDRGRVSTAESRQALVAASVVLAISRHSLEAELGSRQRVVEALCFGRPVVMTRLGDLAAAVEGAAAGITVPAADPGALGAALLKLRDDGRLGTASRNARELFERTHAADVASQAFVEWLKDPDRRPGDGAGVIDDRLVELERELVEIRSSWTFRALRLLDRLLGRRPAS